ncbi:MFS general substrate transporter [Rhizoctonia solani]|uniref:MFS general substrate transporter n=1 Tax=Rhizoctonia solani TaxID=456999 RepID=A0A8H7H993_9AGAM|nr:MFS general substrate transporter [Rhizoctonia solani]
MNDEQQPLLGPTHVPHEDASLPPQIAESSVRRQNADDEESKASTTPLPMKQISILLLMQLSEPLSYTVIYPFVAQFVNETGITGGDGSKVGYYAGMIVRFFGPLKYDSIQRIVGVDILHDRELVHATVWPGVRPDRSAPSAHVRAIRAGTIDLLCWVIEAVLAGNAGVAKSMVVELTDETNQAQAFAFLPIVWSTGSTLGPFLGGTLSHPAKLLPSTHTVQAKQNENHTTEYGTVPTHPPQPRRSVSVRSVLTKRARAAIANYAFLAFSDITYLGLLPIVFAVSVENGGLGFTPRAIGLILGLQGIITGLVQVFFFAAIHRRLGSKKLYVTGYLCYSLLLLSLPIMHALAVMEMKRTIWVVLGLHIALSCPAFMAFSCVAIYVNSSAPSKDSLGTLNGISQTIISVIRAIGPAAATSLFSLSIEKNILGGNFVYAVLLGISLIGVYASRWLKEVKRAYESTR